MLPEVTDFCRLFLLRHPELDPKLAHVAVGGGAAELSRRGRATVLEWIRFFDGVALDRIVSATMPQSLEAARALGQAMKVEVEEEPRWDDQRLGAWEGQQWAEVVKQDPDGVKEFFASYGEVSAPGGESLGEAIERCLGWWQDAAPGAATKTLAVVAAGPMLSGFTGAMLGLRLSRTVSLQLPPGGIGVVDVFANGVRLTGWNLS